MKQLFTFSFPLINIKDQRLVLCGAEPTGSVLCGAEPTTVERLLDKILSLILDGALRVMTGSREFTLRLIWQWLNHRVFKVKEVLFLTTKWKRLKNFNVSETFGIKLYLVYAPQLPLIQFFKQLSWFYIQEKSWL